MDPYHLVATKINMQKNEIDESARTNEEELYIYNFLVTKTCPNREKTLKPRPSNRVRTNKLHGVCHGNLGLFDDSPIPQFEL